MSSKNLDLNLARFNMVEQQIRTWDVLDLDVLDLLQNTPRENFVPEKYKNVAYSEIEIPLDHGVKMLSPMIQGHLLQALDVKNTDVVLEIGTGTGYVAAMLAKAAQHVYCVDFYGDMLLIATENLKNLGIKNFTTAEREASQGWEERGPYNAIAVNGSMKEIPQTLKEQLKIGGRLFVIEGEAPTMLSKLITRTDANQWEEHVLFETNVSALLNCGATPKFVF